MKRFLIALLLMPSLAWAAGFSTERWGSSLRGPGFAPMQRGSGGSMTPTPDPFDRSGLLVEYDFSSYSDPGVGQSSIVPDSSGNNKIATCSLESAKPALVGQHIVIAANDGLTMLGFQGAASWTIYLVSDPDSNTAESVVLYDGAPTGPCIELSGIAATYGAGYTNSAPSFEYGKWDVSGAPDLPKAVYAWSSDGTYAKHYYAGTQNGSTAGPGGAGNSAIRGGNKGILCYASPGGNYAILGKHWYMSIFSGEHSASRVASTSAALWTLYGGRS